MKDSSNTAIRLVAALLVAIAVAGSAGKSLRAQPATRAGVWTELPRMAQGHFLHTATLLDGGKVLVAGGYNCVGANPANPICRESDKADLYRPASNDWISVASMSVVRVEHDAAVLLNGKVLVAGGRSGASINDHPGYSSAEIFDPSVLGWSMAGSMGQPRVGLTLTRLFDGRVLAVGGGSRSFSGGAGAELYDPATDTWSPTGAVFYLRKYHRATLLRDGRVLVTGGYGLPWNSPGTVAITALTQAEVYDPATNTWSSTASGMATARALHTATLLPAPLGVPRKVLVVGGRTGAAFANNTAEIYDPATDSWTPAASMAISRSIHAATLLLEGQVLVTGGLHANDDLIDATSELYDPSSNTWSMAAPLPLGLAGHRSTVLTYRPTSKVLVTGGLPGLVVNFIYQPSPISMTNTLFSSANPSSACQAVTLTSSLVSSTGLGTATGTVTFKDGGAVLGTKALDQYGQASLTVSTLSGGTHDLTAEYNGDAAFLPAIGALQQTATPFSATIGGAPNAAIGLGTSISLIAGAAGGSGPYSFAWSRDGAALSTAGTLVEVPSLGSHSYSLTATANGCVSPPTQVEIDVFGFSISLGSATLPVLRGEGASTAVTIALAPGSATNGLPLSASIDATGAPQDMSTTSAGVPFPSTTTAPTSTTFTAASGPISLGDESLSVRVIAGGVIRSAPLDVHLYDFSVTVLPASQSAYRAGAAVSYTLATSLTPGSSQIGLPGALNLAVAGLPSDAAITLAGSAPLVGSTTLSVKPGPASSGIFAFTGSAAAAGSGGRSAGAVLQILTDATPPLITPVVSGTLGSNGWYRSDVAVGWTVSDPESTITSQIGCGNSVVSADTVGTTFTCQATSDGGTAQASLIIKRDVTQPALAVPATLIVNATGIGGATVAWSVNASDNLDPNPIVACIPASGSTFPVGTTTVTCSATDAAGNQGSAVFQVVVKGAGVQIGDLVTYVNSLIGLPGNSLTNKLQNALAAIAAGNTNSACANLDAFINEVNAQSGKTISPADAAYVIGAANRIRSVLGCR